MSENQISRRQLVGGAALIAAASADVIALPAAVAKAEPADQVLVWTTPAGARKDAWYQLESTLNEEQRALLYRIDADHSDGWLEEQEEVIAELRRHFPPFAAAIESIYAHVVNERWRYEGKCCQFEVTGQPVAV